MSDNSDGVKGGSPMASDISLRDVQESDLPIFFAQQQDPSANYMAAFTANDPADKDAFMAHWNQVLHDDSITIKTIVCDGQVAGNILCFNQFGEREVGYWLGKAFWGRGIATRALALFLDLIPTRPLYARAAKDNAASIRVLEKCGFTIYGVDRGFSNVRSKEIEEALLRLEAPHSGA